MSSQKRERPGALVASATEANNKAGGFRYDNTKGEASKEAFPAQAAWKRRNPLKTWAHACLRSGVRKGLVEPQPCEVCGEPKTDAHHSDYQRPLLVEWLCRKHHKQRHARSAKRAGGADGT